MIYIEQGIRSNDSHGRLSDEKDSMHFTRILIQFPEMGTLEITEKNLRGFQLTITNESILSGEEKLHYSF